MRSAIAQSLDEAPTAVARADERSARQGAEAATSETAGAATAPSGASGPRPIASAGEGATGTGTAANVTLGGYVEAFWQYNFNRPYNGETAARGFDTRHNTFTLANVVLDASWSVRRDVSGRIALQVGHTPETYYAAEPGTGSASRTGLGREVWKFIQQAWVAYLAPVGPGVLLEAGVFLSPIGPEGMAIKDQWNWSRSNLFYGLPFYHTGVRGTVALSPRMNLTLAGYNGWNSVVDNNDDKSLALHWTYNLPDRLTVSALYFSGVERPFGAPGGRGWRHLFDGYCAWHPRSWLSLAVHGNGGFEPISEGEQRGASRYVGTQWWAAGAAYARVRFASWLWFATRADVLVESIANQPAGATSAPEVIFFSSDRVSANRVASVTATLDTRPRENVSLRVEFRHDNADQPIYFDEDNTLRPGVNPTRLGRRSTQNTLTLGMTAWY
jgi:hypothetical protein